MRLGSGPTQSHLVTNSEVSLGWGEGFWQSQPLVFVLVISTDSILSLSRLALREGQGLARGHTASGD